eukprot:TRINITY_DN1728_c0_g1_i1.p1 TRINITY_DN1728_c0_g1~~TRINITY_DN1728_c0_g1_i1.p1  ORF type:complete len:579 (+),score=141.60 TRINITY_DN1728_c0_g1_i1:767-2503(+)
MKLCSLLLLLLGIARATVISPPPLSATLVTIPSACGSGDGQLVYGTRLLVGSFVDGNAVAVEQYGSIPFAQPPVGELRWKPPQPVSCNNNTAAPIDGTVLPSACIQPDGSGDEDCLYLNVIRRPASTQSEDSDELVPVVVYFHGGNLIAGSAPGSVPGMQQLVAHASKNLVVVTVAYRLNLLGWLAVDELAEEAGDGPVGNYGLMDAIAALKWIKDNIRYFGGDPQRVILSGQSSGGTLIFALMAAPVSQGLFRGAISLSGSANMSMTADVKFQQDADLVGSLGCSNAATASDRLQCMRSVPANQVGLAMPNTWNTPIPDWTNQGMPQPKDGGFNFAGIVYVDGKLIQMSFKDSFASGINGDVGFIFSNTQSELDVGADAVVNSYDEWVQAIKMGFEKWESPNETISQILIAYSDESQVDGRLAYGAFISDIFLTCSNINISVAAAINGARKAPTYIIYNAWNPSNNTNENGSAKYAYHTLDLKEIGRDWSGEDVETDLVISQLLQDMIVDFAYNEGTMPSNWAWPGVTKDAVSTLVLSQIDHETFPGFGVRVVSNWKMDICASLESLGLGQDYWWCD